MQKQPLKLPLTYTAVDLEDILAPGSYRLDLVDQRGEPLGPTVPVTIGNLRNGSEEEATEEDAEPAVVVPTAVALPPSSSDTRLVLEANIRATHLAFQHNQRTLELGLRMAETLREGVQALVEAQADVMKSMSANRGFYRNAAPAPMLPAPAEPPRRAREPEPAAETDDDEDDYEEEEPAAAQPDWLESVKPLLAIVTQQIVTTVMGMKSGGAGGGFQLKDMLDWSQPAKRNAAAQAALDAGGSDAGVSAAPTPSVEEQLADPATSQHVFAIMASLTPEERAVAGKLATELSDAERAGWFKELKRLSVDDAVKKVRDLVASLIKKPAA